MSKEELESENAKLKDAIGNTILNLQSYIDSWEDLDFLRRSALKRTMNKLKASVNDEELLKRIQQQNEYWKRLGKL